MKKETEIQSLHELASLEMQEIVSLNNGQEPHTTIQLLTKEQKAQINKEILLELGINITTQNRMRFAMLWAFLFGHNKETKSFQENNNVPFDFTKGILIAGGTGIGKTCLMRWFLELTKRVLNCKVRMSTASDVVSDFKQYGEAIIKRHGLGSFSQHAHRPIPNYNEPIHEYFDDLGTEENVMIYGQKTDVFKQILTDRHRMFLEHGLFTFASTNLNPTQLLERYGDRVDSRIKQMFNIWHIGGEDLRK